MKSTALRLASPEPLVNGDIPNVARAPAARASLVVSRAVDPFDDLAPRGFEPRFDVMLGADRCVIRADLPGVRREDVVVTVRGTTLTIRGTRRDPSDAANELAFARERSFGDFERTFLLPRPVDGHVARARIDHGVLIVEAPLAERKSRTTLELTLEADTVPAVPMAYRGW